MGLLNKRLVKRQCTAAGTRFKAGLRNVHVKGIMKSKVAHPIGRGKNPLALSKTGVHGKFLKGKGHRKQV